MQCLPPDRFPYHQISADFEICLFWATKRVQLCRIEKVIAKQTHDTKYRRTFFLNNVQKLKNQTSNVKLFWLNETP